VHEYPNIVQHNNLLFSDPLLKLRKFDFSNCPQNTFVGFAHSIEGTRESTGFLETLAETISDPKNSGKDLAELFDRVCKQCSTDTIKIVKAGTTDGTDIICFQKG
jgi:hypothetical protein